MCPKSIIVNFVSIYLLIKLTLFLYFQYCFTPGLCIVLCYDIIKLALILFSRSESRVTKGNPIHGTLSDVWDRERTNQCFQVAISRVRSKHIGKYTEQHRTRTTNMNGAYISINNINRYIPYHLQTIHEDE